MQRLTKVVPASFHPPLSFGSFSASEHSNLVIQFFKTTFSFCRVHRPLMGPPMMCQNKLLTLTSFLAAFIGTTVKGCFPLLQPFGGGACGGGMLPCQQSPSSAYSYPSAGGAYSMPYQQPPYYHASKSRTMASADNAKEEAMACIRRFTDTRLHCALPFERRTPSDERECQRHCARAAPRCRSFQYDPMGSVCDLFENSLASEDSPVEAYNSDGWKQKQSKKQKQMEKKKRQRRFVLHNGVPLDGQSQAMLGAQTPTWPTLGFQRTAAAGVELASPSSSSTCQPILEHRAGVIFVGLEQDCDAAGLQLLDDENGGGSNNFIPPPPPTTPFAPSSTSPSSSSSSSSFPTSTSGQIELLVPAKPSSSNRREQSTSSAVDAFFSSASSSAERMPSFQSRQQPSAADCPDGGRARVQLIDGISLLGPRVLTAIQLDSADVCLHVCRQNAHLDGRPFAGPCRSATFHRQSGRCEILSEAISPNGQLQYVPNPDSLYFEKLCIPQADLSQGCDDVIHRIPQHHLDPRPVAGSGLVQTAANQLECVRQCIGAKNRLGFACVSASFFFDWPSQNCWLSRFTRLSRPDMYAAERRELVDYMEMPPCFQLAGIRQHDSPSTGWSACMAGQRWRKRANCTASGSGGGNCTESEPCSTEGQKLVAPSVEVAKRFRAPAVESSEASLFGEQDYESQKEVSFFGPPHAPSATRPNVEENRQEQNYVEDSAEQQQQQPSGGSDTNGNGKKSCDPRQECCPLEEQMGSPIVRGCSLGKRTLADGRTVGCLPEKCQRRK